VVVSFLAGSTNCLNSQSLWHHHADYEVKEDDDDDNIPKTKL